MLTAIRLALYRLRARRGAAALIAFAIAATIGLTGTLSGIAVVTEDRATVRALDTLPPRDRSILVSAYSLARSPDRAGRDARIREALESMSGYTAHVVRASIIRDPFGPTAMLAVDDAGRWVEVLEGRLPEPCVASPCEAVVYDPEARGLIFQPELGDMAITIVGRVDFRDAFPISAPGGVADTVIVEGIDRATGLAAVGSMQVGDLWSAVIDPGRIRAWDLAGFQAAVSDFRRQLVRLEAGAAAETPVATVEDVRERSRAAAGRLVLIGSLAAAVLLSFAVFAAAVGRQDVAHEYRRLVQQGARRRQLLAFVAAEAGLPALVGAFLGVLVSAVAVAALSAWQETPPVATLGAALLTPSSIQLMAGLALLAALAVMAGIHPGIRRAVDLRILFAAVVPLFVVLGWDLATRGPLDDEALAARAAEPVLVLGPALLGALVILVLMLALPTVFRAAARLARRAPIVIRLSLQSVARDPDRPAAALTLLTFSVGAIVFAASYAATLRQSAADRATFATGMDLRITEDEFGGPGIILREPDDTVGRAVVPLERYEALGDDLVFTPVVRQTIVAPTIGSVELIGIDPVRLRDVKGFRADFGDRPIDQLVAAFDMPGEWRLAGHDLPAGERSVRVTVDAAGDTVRMNLVIQRPDGAFATAFLGELGVGRQELTARLPAGAVGGRIVGLTFQNGGDAATVGGPNSGRLQEASVVVENLDGLRDRTPIQVSVSGASGAQTVTAAQATDGLILPAVVGDELARDAGPDGVIALSLGGGKTILIRVAAVMTDFPTSDPALAGEALLDIEPLTVALNAARPGIAAPTEIWMNTPSSERTAEVRAALAEAPFNNASVRAAVDVEAELAADPFANGISWALVAAAVAGLALAVVGLVLAAAVHLRDETGELAELEAQGVEPSTLSRLAVARNAWLTVSGVVAGVAVGILLTQVAGSVVTVGGSEPGSLSRLIVVQPWQVWVVVAALVVIGVGAVVAALARQRFGGELISGR